MIYGANGYTGRRIASEAARRGQKPLLAGRRTERIAPLAAELDLPGRVFPLDCPDRVAAQIEGLRAVLHCAGPFSATAEPMMEACLEAGVDYLDITGEIAVIEAAAARHGRAVASGIRLLPAVGFDVVPSDCLAAKLAGRLPDATQLILAFCGVGAISPGTANTMLEGLPRGGRARIDGRITEVPAAWKSMEIPFRDGRRWAVTIPWGDVASAWHSTGIPNVEVYLAMAPGRIRWLRRLRPLLPALRLPFPKRLLRAVVRHFVGPRASGQPGRASFWGRASNSQGDRVEATLETPDGYALTVATALASVERVLASAVPAGFATPSQAFGADFIVEIPDAEFRWQ
jgi:short subunit dehydrogenase-like uncharacterized protein